MNRRGVLPRLFILSPRPPLHIRQLCRRLRHHAMPHRPWYHYQAAKGACYHDSPLLCGTIQVS